MRWEYFRVRVRGDHAAPSSIAMIGDDGNFYELQKQPGDKDNAPVISRLLQRLGDEGWELVSIAQTGDSGYASVIYFKRIKA